MSAPGNTAAHREIDAATLNTMLADGSALLIDVREPCLLYTFDAADE